MCKPSGLRVLRFGSQDIRCTFPLQPLVSLFHCTMSTTTSFVTVDDSDTTRITYRGDWQPRRSSNGDYMSTVHRTNSTASATFNFNGMPRTQLTLQLRILTTPRDQAPRCKSSAPSRPPHHPPRNTQWTAVRQCPSRPQTSLRRRSNNCSILRRRSMTAPMRSLFSRAMDRTFTSILYNTVPPALLLLQPARGPPVTPHQMVPAPI
jgi:hypothetical protein